MTSNTYTTQIPDQDDLDELEAAMDRYQSDTPWQSALADAQAHGDEEQRNSQLDAIEAEIQRAEMREGWLADRLAEVQYSEGARDCDRAVRRAAAIETELDRIQARQTELARQRVVAQDAADDWPNANYDPADDCGPDAGIETTACQA